MSWGSHPYGGTFGLLPRNRARRQRVRAAGWRDLGEARCELATSSGLVSGNSRGQRLPSTAPSRFASPGRIVDAHGGAVDVAGLGGDEGSSHEEVARRVADCEAAEVDDGAEPAINRKQVPRLQVTVDRPLSPTPVQPVRVARPWSPPRRRPGRPGLRSPHGRTDRARPGAAAPRVAGCLAPAHRSRSIRRAATN